MERNKILQNQQKLTNQINQLLEASSDSLLCGPSCQKERKIIELKEKYLSAQTNLQTAPIQLDEAREKYLVLKDGEAAYNKIRFQELEKEADSLKKQILEKFNEQIQNVNLMNHYLDAELTNAQNTEELLADYTIKDNVLKKELGDKVKDIITNDRKSYYENQELDRLKLWTNILNVIYIVFLILLTLEILFSESLKLPVKFVIIFIFYLYPFTINWIAILLWKIITKIYYTIYYFFPKTSYLSI